MKILIINPPMQVNMKPEVPSFGIAYITEQLKTHGYSVEILDIDANRYSKPEVSEFIRKIDSDFVGIGGLVTVYPYLYWLIPEIKRLKPGIEIILGGPVASSLKERCFERFPIDYEVIGEGENTIIELLRELRLNRNLDMVKGIGFRRDGKVVFTENRPLMTSLDNVPIFNDTLFPIERLLQNTGGTIQIHTQRGCPSNCTFCFNSFRVVSKHVRYRPVENIIKEIVVFKEKYRDKIKLFAISGECITMNKGWLISFCKELIKNKINIRYRVTSRVDTIDEERLIWLEKSGCVTMSLGLESGSPKILQMINKGTTVEQNMRAVLMAKRHIKEIEASIILGYIGEDRQTLAETVRFCKEIGVRPSLFFATPFPGTELYRWAVEKGRINDEEAYLMGLDRAAIFNLSLNLTDMPDSEAFKNIRSAANEIEKHYVSREIRSLKISKRVISKLTKDGFGRTASWIFKRSKEIFIGHERW